MIKTLAIIAFSLGVWGLIHHYLVTGLWWQWSDFWHHEPLIAMAFVGWITLLFIYLVERSMVKRWGEQ